MPHCCARASSGEGQSARHCSATAGATKSDSGDAFLPYDFVVGSGLLVPYHHHRLACARKVAQSPRPALPALGRADPNLINVLSNAASARLKWPVRKLAIDSRTILQSCSSAHWRSGRGTPEKRLAMKTAAMNTTTTPAKRKSSPVGLMARVSRGCVALPCHHGGMIVEGEVSSDAERRSGHGLVNLARCHLWADYCLNFDRCPAGEA